MRKTSIWTTAFAVLAIAAIAAAASRNTGVVVSPTPPAPTQSTTFVAEPAPALLEGKESTVSEEAPTQLTPLPANPEAASAMATYAIDWYSVNGGGTVSATSTNYRMGASIGQSVAGAASSANYRMGIGFWYGAGASGGCACDCHGNPVCDAAICDVLDVVSTVNVAFRNGAAIPDPNANCPYETTDVDCSTFTDVIDVVRIVNVAFRNANPATEFCSPCS